MLDKIEIKASKNMMFKILMVNIITINCEKIIKIKLYSQHINNKHMYL